MTSPTLFTSPLAIIGLGNQARSWALNLFDSGQKIVIGIRKKNQASENFVLEHPQIPVAVIDKDWLMQFDNFALLIPDDQHLYFLQHNHRNMKPQSVIIYAHGFSEYAYQLSHAYPQFHHVLLAPKSIATELRSNFLHKKNLAAVYSVKKEIPIDLQTSMTNFLLKTAKNLGITWGPFPVSFEQECKADLFSEQTLLCNLLPNVTAKAFSLMLKKNIPWQLAFCEIFLELKLIVNAMEDVGPEKFFELISPNALMGSDYYHKNWSKQLPFDELFEQCWKNLENSKMIDYLKSTPVDKIRHSVMQEWKNCDLNKAYQNYKKDLDNKE